MKHYLALLGIIIGTSSLTAQVTVELQDDKNNIVYRGFDNILTIQNGSDLSEDDYTLVCENCTLLKEMQGTPLPENVFNLHAGKAVNSLLYVKMNANAENEFLFRVRNLPVAELQINGVRNGGSLAEIQGSEKWNLKVAYPEEISLKSDSDIISWECIVDDKMYAGMSSELSKEFIQAIRETDSGTLINFVFVDVDNRTGIRRKSKASFRI